MLILQWFLNLWKRSQTVRHAMPSRDAAWRNIVSANDHLPADPRNPSGETWGEYKRRQLLASMDNWSTTSGECLSCGLPIRLHPPERALLNCPEYCDFAATQRQE